MNRKKRVKLIIIGGVLILSCSLYKPFIDYLSKQAANPDGVVGKMITNIWSGYFTDLNRWGLSQVDLKDKKNILDIGFGGGSGIKYIMDRNLDCVVYGVDISKESLKTATKLNKSYIDSRKVRLYIADVKSLPFEGEYFDFVNVCQSHIYWDELENGVLECYRTLKDNGILLITCEIDKINYHLPEYKEHEDFVKLLYKTGFKDVKVKRNGNYIAFTVKR